jgi:hypothetical protein
MSYKGGDKIRFTFLEFFGVFVASSLLLLTVYRSGTMTDFGLSFWGPNGHDAVFHISVIRSLAERLNFSNPLMVGETIKNYHLGFDLLVTFIYKLTGTDIFDLFFRWIPLLVATSLGFVSLLAMKRLGFGKWERVVGLLCLVALGSFGFIKTIFQDPFAGESVFWANQSISMLLNPPFALSLVGLFAWIYGISGKKNLPIWAYFLPSVMFHIKAYSGLLMIGALCIETLYKLIATKNERVKHIALMSVSLVVFFVSVQVVLGGSSLISFDPLWFVKQMFSSGDRLYNERLAVALDNWLYAGSLTKLATLQVIGLIVFLTGNLGVRILGFKQMIKSAYLLANRLIIFITLLGIVVPLLFVQKGTPWNTIQFMYYSMALLGIYTGQFLVQRLKMSRNIIGFLGWATIFILGSLTSLGTVRDYLSPIPASYVSHSEIKLLSYTDGDGLLSRPFSISDKRRFNAPLPLYVYESTAYIGLFGKSQCYLCDEVNLTITGADFADRTNKSRIVFGSGDVVKVNKILQENSLEYIYLDPLSKIKFDPSAISYRMIASNGGFELWQRTK